VLADRFSVALIPHTLVQTTLGFKKVGDAVNLETDIIAKYVGIPPVRANSDETVDASASADWGRGGRHDALNGVALAARNSHQINPRPPASPGGADPALWGR
jgi:hypothetical protein